MSIRRKKKPALPLASLDGPAEPLTYGGERLVRKREVLERVGVTFPTLWVWMRRGEFPRARELGAGKLCWLESELTEWMKNRPTRTYKGDEVAA